MALLYILVISVIVWPLLKAMALGTIIVKTIRKCPKKEWKSALEKLSQYLTARADRKVFLEYLTTMGVLAGMFPSSLSFVLEYSNIDYCLKLRGVLEDNADWVSAILGGLTTIGYYLYLRSKCLPTRKDWKQMAYSVSSLSSHIAFELNTEWFDRQYDRSIKSLGTRYSEMINFPIDSMPEALAVTARDEHLLLNLLEDDYNKVSEKLRKVRGCIDANKLEKLYKQYSRLQNFWANFNVADIPQILNAIEKLSEDCQALRFDENGKYRNNYTITQLCEAVDGLCQKTSGQWFSYLQKKTLVIAGTAGSGKSHFLGELLTQRHKANMPTLLVTGKAFNSSSEPLVQLCSHFDYVGRKEMFLKELNEYGGENSQRVLLIIDGINEGAGADFWKNQLDDFVHQIESYDNLGLVLSVRTSSSRNWAYDLAHNDAFAVYEHKGFYGNTQQACEYFFRSFDLAFPNWPIIGEEYSNPLFLLKYCRSHQMSELPLDREDFWTTINNYCTEVNKVLAQQYHYNPALNLVFDSLVKVAELMVTEGKRWRLEYKDVIDRLSDVAQYVDQPKRFLDYLIDEGLLQMDIYDDTAFIDFGYERFGEFFISYYLVTTNTYKQWLSQRHVPDLYALSILVPKLLGKELYEEVPESRKSDCYTAFFETLPYRENITDEAEGYLRNLPIKNKGLVILTSFRCLTRMDYPLNANTLYDLLSAMSLAECDSQWTIWVSEGYGECFDCASSLVEWGYGVSQSVLASMDDAILLSCAEGLTWILSSTNQKLRDKATHAIVNITIGRTSVMERLITRFSHINDPYIQERLWAAIYGSVLCCQSADVAVSIAKTTYKAVFDVAHVVEDIIVRDFAKGIIEYACYLDHSLEFPIESLCAPLNATSLPAFPDGNEINRRYKLDFDTTENKEEYIAQQAILSSMATEHDTREPIYGDFGRYVFQSHIDVFHKVTPMQMSWWAIAMIFEEFGYDVKMFAQFDSRHQSRDRGFHCIERIGKKYQRISLNRIIAILTDVFPDVNGDIWNNPWLVQRSIDPTLAPLGLQTDDRNDRFSVPRYDLFAIKDDSKWMRATSKMPPISEYLQVSDISGEKWINLFSYNSIVKRPPNIEESDMTRDLWVFVQSFIIDKKHLREVTHAIYKHRLERLLFHENGEISHLYTREFFWSGNYRKTVEDAGFSHVPFQIGGKCWDSIITEPTYLQYLKDSSEDYSTEYSFGMLLPNQCLFEGLDLMYAKENGAWVDKDGVLICYDNFVYGHGHSALLVRQSSLIDYLNKNDKVLVWPILMERLLRAEGGFGSNHVQCGGYAYLTSKGKIKYKFRSYEPSHFSKWKAKQSDLFLKKKIKTKLFLAKHKLIKLSLTEHLRYMSMVDIYDNLSDV